MKLYDKATAPVIATDTPVWRVMVPANGQTIQIFDGLGLAFTRGLSFVVVTGIADIDATAVAAASYIVGLSTCGGGN